MAVRHSHVHIAVAPLVLDSDSAAAQVSDVNDSTADCFASKTLFQLETRGGVPSPLLIRALLDAKSKRQHPMEAWLRAHMEPALVHTTPARPRRTTQPGMLSGRKRAKGPMFFGAT